jgi:hypothetical protein
MKTRFLALVPGLCLLLIGPGCGSRPEVTQDPVPVTHLEEQTSGTASAATLHGARDLLQAGQVDDAAARLAQMQVHGLHLDEAQAREYRQTYAEIYDRAIEAVQRGDPRGEAALHLLRKAAPR